MKLIGTCLFWFTRRLFVCLIVRKSLKIKFSAANQHSASMSTRMSTHKFIVPHHIFLELTSVVPVIISKFTNVFSVQRMHIFLSCSIVLMVLLVKDINVVKVMWLRIELMSHSQIINPSLLYLCAHKYITGHKKITAKDKQDRWNEWGSKSNLFSSHLTYKLFGVFTGFGV